MKIRKIETGYLQENCYIIEEDECCLIVDPGDDLPTILKEIGKLQVLGVLITHHHFDHVGALKELLLKTNVTCYDHEFCQEKNYKIGPFSFDVLFFPGHSLDSIGFYFKKEKKMFVGDFVFYRSIGRTDLEGGNFLEMQQSIRKLLSLEEDIILYPGHGRETTLLDEKKYNPYF